ncbi:hypothetical protein Dsin_030079 [Dipteronia sinensis]|uniref:Uncharacterized protein n=1 Tax=Dipteronia sinensis TaxID=43782 RepID=A0AAE0DQP5_9ROSI|nr:hypothetical protein Dsin_030079 [Dipteronia sinensis]
MAESISENPSKISGNDLITSSNEFLVISARPPMVDPVATIDSVTASLRRSKPEEIIEPIISSKTCNKDSKQALMASPSCSNAPWIASPGTLNAWMINTRRYAAVLKINRVIRVDNVVMMQKMQLRMKTIIFFWLIWKKKT